MAQEVKSPLAMQETQETQVQSPDKQIISCRLYGEKKIRAEKGGL